MRSSILLWCAAVIGVLCGVQPCAAGLATFSLGTAAVSGNTVSFEVYLTFSTTPADTGFQASTFGIDVSASSLVLSPNGDYGAWSFNLNSTVLQSSSQGGWTTQQFGSLFQVSDTPNVNPVTGKNYPFQFGLAAGSYDVGTLTYDLSYLPITTSSSYNIDITGADNNPVDGYTSAADPGGHFTFLFDGMPNEFPTTEQSSVAFTNSQQAFPGPGGGGPVVPTPSALVLASIGGALLIVTGLVRRNRGRSLKPVI